MPNLCVPRSARAGVMCLLTQSVSGLEQQHLPLEVYHDQTRNTCCNRISRLDYYPRYGALPGKQAEHCYDTGQSNISAYSMGMMGYRTPNIDSIATGGMIFTDYYAEQSCTAGRASFITGQHGLRTGLTKVGLPGATLGLQIRRLPHCSKHVAMPPRNLARIILVTAMNSCRRFMALTSFTEICIT